MSELLAGRVVDPLEAPPTSNDDRMGNRPQWPSEAAHRAATHDAHASHAAAVTTWQAHGHPACDPAWATRTHAVVEVGQAARSTEGQVGQGSGQEQGRVPATEADGRASSRVAAHQDSSVHAGRSSRHQACSTLRGGPHARRRVARRPDAARATR